MKLALAGNLTIMTATDVKARMLDGFAAGDALEIDTQQVTETDVAGLQVLFAAFKSAVASGTVVRFPKESRGPAVSAALRLLGLSDVDWNQRDTTHGKEDPGR